MHSRNQGSEPQSNGNKIKNNPQRPPRDEHFENIVFPIDYKKEDKQKGIWAIYLNKHFKSKICLFIQKSNDSALKKHIHSNLVFTKNLLDANGIEYVELEADGKSVS